MSHHELVLLLPTAEYVMFVNALGPVNQAWLSAVLALAPLVAKLAGGMSKDRSEARVQEAGLNQTSDRLALDRADQAQKARAADESTAVRSGLLEGVKDASFARPEGAGGRAMAGGLRPSAITGGSAMGKQFKDDALARIASGSSTPSLTPNPKASKFDMVLNLVSSLAGGLSGVGQGMDAINGLKKSSIPNVEDINVNSDPTSFLKKYPGMVAAPTPTVRF